MLGAGNVATHLAENLQTKGFKILQVYSRSESSAKQLSEKLKVPFTTDIKQINNGADIYLYALKDNALSDVIKEINLPNALHVHTAGSVSMTIFKDAGNNFGVMYPLQTFSKTKKIDFSTIPVFIEGSNKDTIEKIQSMAELLTSKVYIINSDQRKRIHLAAVFACNFSNFMYSIAEEILIDSNLPFDILNPLIIETAEKVKTLSPAEAQTGPAVRFDDNIISKHMSLLNDKPQYKNLYREISMLIHNKAKQNTRKLK